MLVMGIYERNQMLRLNSEARIDNVGFCAEKFG